MVVPLKNRRQRLYSQLFAVNDNFLFYPKRDTPARQQCYNNVSIKELIIKYPFWTELFTFSELKFLYVDLNLFKKIKKQEKKHIFYVLVFCFVFFFLREKY